LAELVASVQSLSVEPLVEAKEVAYDVEEAYKRGYTDINFFASVALPTVMISALPVFYVIVWQILVNRKEIDFGKILRFALGLPRGHAKTTFIKILICWLIVYDKISFALMICASEPLAEQLLADIHDILGSPNMEAIYGRWTDNLSTDRSDLKKAFYHKRAVILAAKGAGSSLRGLNIKHTRPDLIFCDDAQTRENDESETERKRLLRWLTATLFKVIAPRGNRYIIYVGNMYSEECILRMFQKNQYWVSLITGAIKEDGTPLWPELHSLEALMESYYHDEELGLADLWFAEVMNDPAAARTGLLSGAFPDCPYVLEEIVPDGVYITLDPAGFRDAADNNEAVTHNVFDGIPCIGERISTALDPELTNPEKLIIAVLEMALRTGASVIGVEDVGYQQTLLFWFNKYIAEYGIRGIHIVPLSPHGRSKEARIRQFIQECYGGTYYLQGDVRAAFVWQASKYKIGKPKNKDDLLDTCAYGMDIRNDYWHLVRNLKTVGATEIKARVVGNNTPF
jgi:hypothetical protein